MDTPACQLDQFRDVFFSWSMCHPHGTGAISSPTLTIKRTLLLDPAVEEFTEFHHLGDEDHDGDDNEEGRTSWGPEDDVDNMMTSYATRMI